LKGCTGAFLVDGVTWNIGPSGVTATCDALFWGAVDGVAANAWFPLPPGTTSLPATAATTTNANPAPANAIAIPNGFNFNNPSLTTLFASLPTGQAPVHDVTISPGSLLPPYQARVSVLAGLGVGAFVNRVNYGASQPRQILAGVGVGAFAQIRSAKKVVAGVGVGAFVEQSQAPPNLEVTWTQTEDGGLEDYVLQAPTFSSTATTSTMTLYYDAALIEDAGIFVNEYTLSYSQWQEFSLVASVQLLIDGQSYPNVISFTMPGRNPYYLDLVVLDEGDWPEVTNPQTLTIIVTATKAT